MPWLYISPSKAYRMAALRFGNRLLISVTRCTYPHQTTVLMLWTYRLTFNR